MDKILCFLGFHKYHKIRTEKIFATSMKGKTITRYLCLYRCSRCLEDIVKIERKKKDI